MLIVYGELKLKTEKSLEKFFLICPIGYEIFLEDELKSILPWLLGPDMKPSTEPLIFLDKKKGGVEIETTINIGYQLNHFVKSAVRILWRWKSKKISHVSELKTWIRGLRPQEYTKKLIRLQISSRKSRLQNEKMISRVFQEDWKNLSDEDSAQALYVDVYDDQFTLSWDLSGEALYKRGLSEKKGTAPLRENLAHLLLQELSNNLTGPELQEATLIDPMMGSGTFLSESLSWNLVITNRRFAYQDFVSVPGFLKAEWWKNLKKPQLPLFGRHEGFDQSAEMVELAKSNLKNYNQVRLEKNDLLKTKIEISKSQNLYLISNPPFGERIAVRSLQDLITASLSTFKPIKALFLVPQEVMLSGEGYTLQSSREFLHGGLEVKALVFTHSIYYEV